MLHRYDNTVIRYKMTCFTRYSPRYYGESLRDIFRLTISLRINLSIDIYRKTLRESRSLQIKHFKNISIAFIRSVLLYYWRDVRHRVKRERGRKGKRKRISEKGGRLRSNHDMATSAEAGSKATFGGASFPGIL